MGAGVYNCPAPFSLLAKKAVQVMPIMAVGGGGGGGGEYYFFLLGHDGLSLYDPFFCSKPSLHSEVYHCPATGNYSLREIVYYM